MEDSCVTCGNSGGVSQSVESYERGDAAVRKRGGASGVLSFDVGDNGLMYVKTAGMGQATAASAAVSGGISAGVQLASTAASLWLNSLTLSHDADTATTQIVNRLAPLLQANVNAYLAGPGTCADQAAAMDGYLTAVQFLFSAQGCGNGSYGSAGNACISDRFGPGGATDPNGAKVLWANYYLLPDRE